MTERVVTIVPEAGLHARPAAKFVQTAHEYDCDVTVAPVDESGGEAGGAADASSMLAVTSLGVGHGERVRLVAEGADAEEALEALCDVLSTPEEGNNGTDGNGTDGNEHNEGE